MKIFAPKYLEEIVERRWAEIDNLSLKSSKFPPFEEDKDGEVKPRVDRLCRGKPCYSIRIPTKAREEYEKFYRRIESLWNSVGCEVFTMETKSRLAVGLGDESVYETSIRLHRNYGVPYVPGSALKGVAKHFAFSLLAEERGDEILRIYESLKEEVKARIAKRDNIRKDSVPEDYYLAVAVVQDLFEKKFEGFEAAKDIFVKVDDLIISVPHLVKIFGTQEQEGGVIFFDAFPTPDQLNKPILELDIINPHYQPYYQRGEAPGDWHSPNPILFLTVPKGVRFQFAIASRNGEVELLDRAKKVLTLALRDFGVGAKTSLGYGRFN